MHRAVVELGAVDHVGLFVDGLPVAAVVGDGDGVGSGGGEKGGLGRAQKAEAQQATEAERDFVLCALSLLCVVCYGILHIAYCLLSIA